MSITQASMEEALTSLAETDEEAATLKTNLERCEILRKRVRQRMFLLASGTVAERSATAETSPEAVAEDDDYIAAMRDYETLRGKRQTWQIIVDTWRTVESSRRRGNI